MPAAPDKRLRCKTPDPGRHKSPDARSLKKAENRIKGKNKDGKSGDSTRSSSGDTCRRKLTFSGKDQVYDIKAENPPGDRRPVQAEPALRKSAKEKMTDSEADSILAKFMKARARWITITYMITSIITI